MNGHAQQTQSNETRADLNEILDVVQTYFNANFEGKPENVDKAFHPVAELYGLDRKTKKVGIINHAHFKELLKNGPSGNSLGVPRHDAVLNVDFSGPETCAVTVRCPVAPNFWTDILILLKTANGWQVVSKTYKTEDSADPATIHDASAEDLVQISGLLKTYFDGLYEGDTAKLGAVFHECAYLRSLDDKGQVTNLARDDWFKAVNSRAKPSETGLARADKILSVTQVGPDLAVAKVKCQIVPRYFTDFLTMIKEERGWKIVSKVYRTDVKN